MGHLPTDLELMAAYHTTRATVREALVLLRREGIIDRVQGRGTFVTAMPGRLDLTAVLSGDPMAIASSSSPSLLHLTPRDVTRDEVPLPAPLAARLGGTPGDGCDREEYVLELEGTPVALVTDYVIPGETTTADARSSDRWRAIVHDRPGTKVESSIGCVAADDAVARRLGVAEGAPVLIVEQVRNDELGGDSSFAVMYFRPDRVLLRSSSLDQAQVR